LGEFYNFARETTLIAMPVQSIGYYLVSAYVPNQHIRSNCFQRGWYFQSPAFFPARVSSLATEDEVHHSDVAPK